MMNFKNVGRFTRRDAFLLTASALMISPATGVQALIRTEAPAIPGSAFAKDSDVGSTKMYRGIHGGKGSIGVKLFAFDGSSAPAHFVIYDIPPGASEGVHVHHLDNRNDEGPFDEYYYIISGFGRMEIDGASVTVSAGDHVHTPLDVSHGIENIHETARLKVFLTFVSRV